MTEQTGIIYEENESFEGKTSYSPDVVLPNAVDPGTEIVLPEPEPVAAYHEYTLDLADTAMVYQPGSLIDTGMVLQYIVDRGHEAISVQAQLDDAGLPTGLLTVRTPVLAPDITVAISKADLESSPTPGSVVYVPATNLEEIPAGYTYSGDLTFAADMRLDALGDEIILEPVVDGAPQTPVTLPGQLTFTPISSFVTVSGLAAGVRSVGLNFVVDASGAENFIQNATITGTLTSDQPRGEEITPGDWAEYTGARVEGLVETVVTWTDTAEGAITPKPDLPRIAAFWLHLEANGYDVQRIRGSWNFTLPDTAPVAPTLAVSAVGVIEPEVIEAFAYSTIDQRNLDAFRTQWAAVTNTTTMERVVSSSVEVDQFEFSSESLFTLSGPLLDLVGPNTDLGTRIIRSLYSVGSLELVPPAREGDYLRLQITPPGAGSDIPVGYYTFRRTAYSNQLAPPAWSYLGYHVSDPTAFISGNPGATALGTDSEAPAPNALAVGVGARALADGSMAIGPNTRVHENSPNAKAIGEGVEIGENGAPLPDYTIWQAAQFEIRQTDRTGATFIWLHRGDSIGSDPKMGRIGVGTQGLTFNGATLMKDVFTQPGDLAVGKMVGTAIEPVRLAKGTTGQVLKVGASGDLEWTTPPAVISPPDWTFHETWERAESPVTHSNLVTPQEFIADQTFTLPTGTWDLVIVYTADGMRSAVGAGTYVVMSCGWANSNVATSEYVRSAVLAGVANVVLPLHRKPKLTGITGGPKRVGMKFRGSGGSGTITMNNGSIEVMGRRTA